MSEETTTSTAPAEAAETAEETPAKDPDRWDDEPETTEEESKPAAKKEEPKAKPVDKKSTKEDAEKEEKAKAEQRERRLRKLMIDGKEEVIDEEEAFKAYAKARTADKRLAEIAEQRKSLEAFKEQFLKDPLSVLNNPEVPLNRKELAQQWLKQAIEEELKDPTQRALEEKEAELQRYKEAEQKAKEEAEQEEQQRVISARREELSKTFAAAMESTVLSKDPEIQTEALREMAMYMRIARQADPTGPMPSPEELAAHVENKNLKGFRTVAQTLSGDQLIEFMGDAVVNKIRKADIERIKKQRGMSEQPQQVQESDSWAKPQKQTKERTFKDPVTMREEVRKRLGL